MTSQTYSLIQEITILVCSGACLAVTISIHNGLKGGALGTPWIFFIFAFGLSTAAAVIQVFDLTGFLISQYDHRLTMLILRPGSALLILIGLILYRKGLS